MRSTTARNAEPARRWYGSAPVSSAPDQSKAASSVAVRWLRPRAHRREPALGEGAQHLLRLPRRAVEKAGPLPQVRVFDEDAFDPATLTRLVAVEVPQELLDGVETVNWYVGQACMHLVWPQFDGESAAFDVRSLTGIEALRGLRTLLLPTLERIPAEQVDALRARGVTVDVC